MTSSFSCYVREEPGSGVCCCASSASVEQRRHTLPSKDINVRKRTLELWTQRHGVTDSQRWVPAAAAVNNTSASSRFSRCTVTQHFLIIVFNVIKKNSFNLKKEKKRKETIISFQFLTNKQFVLWTLNFPKGRNGINQCFSSTVPSALVCRGIMSGVPWKLSKLSLNIYNFQSQL